MQLVVCSFGRGTGGALCHAQRHPTKDFRRPRRHRTHTHASRLKGMTHTREAKGAEGGGKGGGGGDAAVAAPSGSVSYLRGL
jgi:hypothetical protein